jgi:hypothetical protein
LGRGLVHRGGNPCAVLIAINLRKTRKTPRAKLARELRYAALGIVEFTGVDKIVVFSLLLLFGREAQKHEVKIAENH